jgi:small subunit ribosomal protein S17
MTEKQTKNKKMYKGKVSSDKMDKTVVVTYERIFKHPLLNKPMRVSKKYKVHDENGEARVGDLVEFYEGRPVSKTKYMYLARIVERGTES